VRPFKPSEIRWKEKMGLPECPYMIRWVVSLFSYSLRLHYWLASDDQRYYHDHAWDYVSIVLWGSYIELMPSTFGDPNTYVHADIREWLSIKKYKAEHKHKVCIVKGTRCLTLVFSWPKRRNWGFWIPGRDKVMRPLRYYSRYGHHPCDD
jgi:hypothetical protein